jgi:hypothetical protein
MSCTLHGFSIGDQSCDPVWFYHRQSAENYKHAHNKPDWIIDIASDNDVDPLFILDTETEIWVPEK